MIAAVIVIGFGAMGFAGGLRSTPSAEPTVESFLLAWQEQRYQAAAALTTGNPKQVANVLRGAYQQLDAAAFYLTMGHISQHGASASAAFQASVDLGQDGAPWKYNGRFSLRQVGSGWRIVWSPSVINPALRPGFRLAVQSSAQPRQMLLDSSGAPLQVPSPVYILGVRPDRLANAPATARALSRVTGLDATQLLGLIRAAPASRVQELVVMRPSQYARLASALGRVPGLIIRRERMRLFTSIAPAVVGKVDTEASPALRVQGIAYHPGATVGLSGLQAAYQRSLAGTPTTEVVMETADGGHVTVLARWSGYQARPVRTTIDSRLQQAAQAAVGSVPVSAAVVAVQASTGHILAVAERKGRGLPEIDPLAHGYPPGTAFTIISTEALLASGLRVDTALPCRPANPVGGTIFRNVPPVPNLGASPAFSTDFAHACATAFSGLSWRLTARDLNAAAADFGLGTSWNLPIPAFSGSVQASGGVSQLASDTIGQGSVRVSPLAMALAAACVESGAWHPPALVADSTSGQSASAPQSSRAALSPASLDTLRSLMQSAAQTNGAARASLPGLPVRGQTGTAPLTVGKRPLWAVWFVGYRADVAFAVLELSATPVISAVPLTERFLAGAPRS